MNKVKSLLSLAVLSAAYSNAKPTLSLGLGAALVKQGMDIELTKTKQIMPESKAIGDIKSEASSFVIKNEDSETKGIFNLFGAYAYLNAGLLKTGPVCHEIRAAFGLRDGNRTLVDTKSTKYAEFMGIATAASTAKADDDNTKEENKQENKSAQLSEERPFNIDLHYILNFKPTCRFGIYAGGGVSMIKTKIISSLSDNNSDTEDNDSINGYAVKLNKKYNDVSESFFAFVPQAILGFSMNFTKRIAMNLEGFVGFPVGGKKENINMYNGTYSFKGVEGAAAQADLHDSISIKTRKQALSYGGRLMVSFKVM
ncbi:hypothetical protein [Candidatus Nesciobacter abundans]|uniref:Outer membrane beta-barrel protein n=1 Tax=Candidatus Nesciobacter abundans TaxID=2601668 RepID=A0A5C0UGB8_9PROT|nr:hypothetical protein [Candidatus Nesciobacter abundans]QEK39155.1 hypothetical protein FZC36_01760 [Candidatus Nesciobacter abundans]|eukprot:TRINITY_DN17423_c0_g1_i1.p1 TRINITY_DN17423_c0_g1~~TRINITY_DN17423_c0_g1_i1.p1  ORF type:complete len:312 (+),score=-2.72 TRINITY_DN17423_c0_g1_i1:11-946(+)